MSNVFLKNTTSASITVAGHKVYYIDSTDAEIVEVEVETSQHVKYNAFKYTLNGTPYWYVIDGTQTEWTDDLSSIGYSEVPIVVLPTVSNEGDFGQYNWIVNGTSGQSTTINAGSTWTDMYISGTTSTPSYNSSKSYAALYRTETIGGSNVDPTVISLVNGNPHLGVKNISSSTITLYSVRVAVCSSNQATVVTVYNASNVAYNAFKYTANNTDYYYVLDGTQTDWTDDLSSIGYRLDMQFYFYFKMDNVYIVNVTFDYPSNNNYWTLRVRNQNEANFLSALGLHVNSSYQDSPYGCLKYDTSVYSYELKEILLPDGSGAAFNLSDFYITYSGSMAAQIWCTSSYSTAVRSCLISIKPIS